MCSTEHFHEKEKKSHIQKEFLSCLSWDNQQKEKKRRMEKEGLVRYDAKVGIRG